MKYIKAISQLTLLLIGISITASCQSQKEYLFHDSHFHLTNYVQEGIDVRKFLEIMGDKAGRSTLFGIPLQQQWSFQNSGSFSPTYYLQSDAPLYYYSFTDAFIAAQYMSLTKAQQDRLDPMITGFNPADMYAWKHIERVLRTFPGVFTGIGEFSIHKEFVSSKVSGEVASLTNPALDSILSFAGKVGLVVILHNDADMPFAKTKADPVYVTQMKDLLRRHPQTTIIWAHTGLGRIVHPVESGSTAIPGRNTGHIAMLESIVMDPAYSHVYFDISWDEVAKYIIATPEGLKNTADLFNKYPDRFLFGTDVVAPPDQKFYLGTYEMYAPLWKLTSKETMNSITKGNYERLFNSARSKVRSWEKANIKRD
jgi:predicted TIM-barrel fold metal-dependent hydrolase